MTTKKDNWKEEKESALVSLFGIHQTKDPDNIIRESMQRVLEIYTQRTLSQQNSYLRSEVEKLPVYQIKHRDGAVDEPMVKLSDILKMMSDSK